MTSRACFDVDILESAPVEFARLSGDWNPLHTDPTYAATTDYGRPVLHGAFAAGLVSRMAGMHLPGTDCLLRSMKLRFVAPVIPPAALRVEGEVVNESGDGGAVQVTIVERKSGRRVVEATYDFGRHRQGVTGVSAPATASLPSEEDAIVVTGATGGLGRAILDALGGRGVGISRGGGEGLLVVREPAELGAALGGRRISALVHCGWPVPDNRPILRLTEVSAAVAHHVGGPLAESIGLAQVLRDHGTDGAMLVLVGSTYAAPGRHAFRKPLYSVAKSMIPTLVHVLALELGGANRRCVGLVFDVLDGGMNRGMSAQVRVSHSDRSPSGTLASVRDAAEQVVWLLGNRGALASGAVVTLSGGAIP